MIHSRNSSLKKTSTFPAAAKFEDGPQFALVLGEELGQIQISTIIKHLANHDLTVLQSQTLDRKKNVLFVELSNAYVIFQEAQELQIMKNYKISPQDPDQNIKNNNNNDNMNSKLNNQISPQIRQTQDNFQWEQNSSSIGSKIPGNVSDSLQSEQLFSLPAEEFIERKAETIQVSQKEKDLRLNSIDPRILLYEKYKPISVDLIDKSSMAKGLGLFTPAERLRITFSYMNKITIKDLKFMEFLQDQGSIAELVPMHEKNAIINDNIQSLEDYYGENISIYFEFLDFYQKWLLIPALAGVLVFLVETLFPQKQQLCNIAYSILICIWTTLLFIFWKRYESELQVKWGVFGKKIYKEDRNVNFKGIKRIKSTTMEYEEYYPRSKRFSLYLISACESVPLLLLAFALKVILFNLSGLISDQNSILYFDSISKLTQKNGILSNIPLKETLLNIVMIVIVIEINELYMIVSQKSTKRENHRTNFEYNSSLVLKRFMFELMNRFTHFFFLAFVIRDVVSLKSMLQSLFLMDEIRKVATESLIPWIAKKFLDTKQQSQSIQEDDTIKRNEEVSMFYTESIREIDTRQYDNFDDYIEVVAQLAFITLFASVAPLASTLSYIFNFFERTSDKFKLQNRLYRRPLPLKVQGIGAWNKVVFLISILCIYTNVAFLAFEEFKIYEITKQTGVITEEQENFLGICTDGEYQDSLLAQQAAEMELSKATQLEETMWLKVHLSIFTLEHIIVILIGVLHLIIKYYPKWVSVFRRRMLIRPTFQKSRMN